MEGVCPERTLTVEDRLPMSDPSLEADRRLVLRSGWFDFQHYAAQTGRAFSGPDEAVDHYLQVGWKGGLDPAPGFDARHYLASYGDARRARINPLLHFLKIGQAQGRRPHLVEAELAERPRAPSAERWRELAASKRPEPCPDAHGAVDVIIPVYRGFDDTLACIEAVLLSGNSTPFRLLVINDCSPEPELARVLDDLAGLGLIELLRNAENLGFVRTANRGLTSSRERDVVLLNSDTVVYGDWLDRMAAHAREGVATVTPFSNNAGPFSYPHVRGDNAYRLELPYEALDALFAQNNRGESVEVPTGVGFCFYMTRAALQALGPFDEGFSPGYGEENEFCTRARKTGWRNLAALDVFVRHTGSVSFEAADGPKAAAAERLGRLHPDYDEAVQAFLEADPLKDARSRVDLARARRLSAGRGILMIEHGWGGGIGRHIDELSAHLADDGVQSFRAAPVANSPRLHVIGLVDFPNLPDLSLEDSERAGETLRQLGLQRVHIHSLVGFELAWFAPLAGAIRTAGLDYDFTAHDYAAVCPRLNMVDWGGVYCSNQSENHCRVCLAEGDVRVGGVDISVWRETYRKVLSGARRVFVPDVDVAKRLHRYRPELDTVEVRPHPPIRRKTPAITVAPAADPETRVVGIVGAIGPGKGSGLLIRMAGDALERALSLRFRIFGYTNRAELNSYPNVSMTGRYEEDDIDELLSRTPPDLMLYPAVAPETFCYALDVAFRTRIFPICFDLGAPARRIRAADFGAVLPFAWAEHPARVNDALLSIEPDASGWDAARVFPEERRWRSTKFYYGPARAMSSVENGPPS